MNEDALEALNLLLQSVPELLALFLILDVRQKNLVDRHIGEKAK